MSFLVNHCVGSLGSMRPLQAPLRAFARFLSVDPNDCSFPGAKTRYTDSLEFAETKETIPTYRVLDHSGSIVNKSYDDSQIPKEDAIQLHKNMLMLNTLDIILLNAQRQGRVPFHMTHYGEEATVVGSAYPLKADDEIFAQYREVGVLLQRGMTLEQIMATQFGTKEDTGKGRQMPMHFGSKKLGFHMISSPLATQMPHASGAGYALRLSGKKNVVVCYFGDGAASEGDFHASLNMAATRGAQTLFFCRNNGFAISTPTSEQFKGDGIASRGFGYGIPSIRVDGNDMLAVIEVTKKARDLTIERKGPVLIEAMSYRRGHHSTSDDSSLYRSKEEIEFWEKEKNPIKRFEQYLIGKGWWTEAESESFSKEVRSKTLQLVSKAELEEKPHLSELFKDVYDEIPPNLRVQQKELVEHLKIHGDRYPSNVPWDGME
uniref:2-oxoisovalerate dehydrogenase subunit alpha n=1 Tax=Stygiella incarcerata TaxID=1712417 RepID=A0A192ZIQ4_9EUKA|nr:branched-chain alphaketoacid dehydrogenase E1a [Stygiella incarcerata]